ncbi:helix-turn-helix domain-containing protein [Jeotgalibaca ciconiae]|uniref:HTH cro/C1-type domain-containing protein n=1 Tax=Jeotgalibaca ciconiae TaxID=2496265 RepID=A0A3S9HAI2_9LACT|nr:Rgg/GadR/MutR family transcriptional regulator [Jeotgalibaca ciconiae]AZP04327.1 hypothetical protein EJN90_06545 [Jeotgalibaca ciconiae]
MNVNFGKTLNQIRRKKNIPINELVEDIMTRSTYNRFKNGEIDTSISKFNRLLMRLNISYEEFLFIHNGYHNNPTIVAILEIEVHFNSGNKDKLRVLQNKLSEEDWENPQAQKHIISLISILLEFSSYSEAEWKNNDLICYLNRVETWTHYEIMMFGNCLKILPTETIDYFLKNILHSYSAYEENPEYQNRISRIMINAIISFLSRKEVALARKWHNRLSIFPTRETLFFESFFEKLLASYLDYAEGEREASKNFSSFVESLQLIGKDELSEKIVSLNHWIVTNY